MTVLRLTVGLTIWFNVINLLILTLSQRPGFDRFEVATIFIMYSFVLLMPLRWALVLTLLVRSVRENPLMMLPRAPLVQVTFVTGAQVVLGVLSLVVWLMIWVNASTGDRVIGFILHAVVPSVGRRFAAHDVDSVVLPQSAIRRHDV